MKTPFAFFALFLFLSLNLQAQINNQFTGQVISQEQEPLTGALVVLQYPWEENVTSAVADVEGNFVLENIEQGGYLLKITYLGYEDFATELTIKDNGGHLGTLTMKVSAMDLSEVEVKEKVLMAVQRGDTTAYNADAFKTLPDANAEDLIRKMPGIVLQNGEVQAEGEAVQQVLIDGQPFFGNDTKAALKNFPAEAVQRIEVFDQESEQSRFSGISDGNTTKTINIVTRPNMRNGQFGKAYGGLGYEDKYQAGGNASLFNNAQRITIIGQANNVNEQNFSSADLTGVSGSSRGRRRGRGGRGGASENFLVPESNGIAETQALGINYIDTWGKKVKVAGSYFFNRSNTISKDSINQEFIQAETLERSYSESSDGKNINNNHRLNLRMEVELDSFTSLVFNPSLSIQKRDIFEESNGVNSIEGLIENRNTGSFESNDFARNLGANLLFRKRFAKRGRTLSLGLNWKYTDQDANEDLSNITIPEADPANSIFASNIREGIYPTQTTGLNIRYNEPLTERLSLSFVLNPEIQKTTNQQLSFVDNGFEKQQDDAESSDFVNINESIESGVGLFYRKDRSFMAVARLQGKAIGQNIDQTLPALYSVKNNYFFFTPFAMLRFGKSRENNFRMIYRGNASLPQVGQLAAGLNDNNPLQLTMGNVDLGPTRTHFFLTRFSNTNTEKSTLFYANVRANVSINPIVNAIYTRATAEPFFEGVDLQRGGQLVRPVNLGRSWSFSSFLTYGLPIAKIKCNLNFNLKATWSSTPGLIDNLRNDALGSNYSFGLTFSSNFSEKLDFTIGSTTAWQSYDYSLQEDLNSKYLDQQTFAKLDWILPADFILRTNLSHRFYKGIAPEFEQDFFLLTAGIGKKVFKNRRGEVLLSVFDLLNQNQAISRTITPTFVEDAFTNVLQRYVMLSFTYNFRNFNVGAEETGIKEEERRWRH